MNWLQYVPYVLLFAAVTALLYLWGLYRAGRQKQDLAQLLSAKGVSVVRRALRRSGPMTRHQLEGVVNGLRVHQPFSDKYLGVTDAARFLDSLLPYMLQQRLITESQEHGKTVYRYRK